MRTTDTARRSFSDRGAGADAGWRGVVKPRRGRIIPFPVGRVRPPADEASLVEIRRCNGAEALVVKSLLESERIPVVLRSRIAHSVHPFTIGDQGEVTVLVPGAEAARARRLLERL